MQAHPATFSLRDLTGFLRRDIRLHDGKQEAYVKLWGIADKPPSNVHVGDNIRINNVVVKMYKSFVSLNSTDETTCSVCYIVTLFLG